MLSIITVPNATAVLASSTDYAATIFTDFLPLIWLAVGIAVAAMGVLYVRRLITRGAGRVLGGGRRGGRRRR